MTLDRASSICRLAFEREDQGQLLKVHFLFYLLLTAKQSTVWTICSDPTVGGVAFFYMCTVRITAGTELLGFCPTSLHSVPGLGRCSGP